MSYRADQFKAYFAGVVKATPATVNTYNSFLQRIDRAIGGLDEAITSQGAPAVLAWGGQTPLPPFDVYKSHARSVLKRYVAFVSEGGLPDDQTDPEQEAVDEELAEAAEQAFSVERDMQVAVRRNLSALEAGLVAVDNGVERSVATGRIDILARDAAAKLTVIELKAGRCPPGAIEQALGYAQSVEDEDGEPVRAVVIASDFTDRQMAASKRIPGLKLVRYAFDVRFYSAE